MLAHVGGNWNNGSNAGLSDWTLGNSSGNVNVNIGRQTAHLTESDASAIISYWGWIKRSNSYYFYNKHVKPYVSVGVTRRAVSYYARIRNTQRRSVGKK